MDTFQHGTYERGLIVAVEEQRSGGALSQAETAGATLLHLDDTLDFDENGGNVEVGGVVKIYNAVDDTLNTITLTTGIAANLDADAEVLISPAELEHVAHIRINGVADENDTVLASIPHSLYFLLPVGIRDLESGDEEWVQIENVVHRGWVVTEVFGKKASLSSGDLTIDKPPGDGNPPTSSPAPTVRGGLVSLFVEWDPVTSVSAVTYEVHVSTSSGFTPDATTLHGEINGTLYVVRVMPDGTALVYGTTYYVKLIAKNASGAAEASAQASATMAQVNTADIVVNAITADRILANAITAEKLAATLIYAGTIQGVTITGGTITGGTINGGDFWIPAQTPTNVERMGIGVGDARKIEWYEPNAGIGIVISGYTSSASVSVLSLRAQATGSEVEIVLDSNISASTLKMIVGSYTWTLTGAGHLQGAGILILSSVGYINGLKRARTFVQKGSTAVVVTTSSTGNLADTFDEAFAATPTVTASAVSSASYGANPLSASTSGFTMYVTHYAGTSASATITCSFVAVNADA